MIGWFKRRREQKEYRRQVEKNWRGHNIGIAGRATSTFYHYHTTGFPIGFPYWLNLDEFRKLTTTE